MRINWDTYEPVKKLRIEESGNVWHKGQRCMVWIEDVQANGMGWEWHHNGMMRRISIWVMEENVANGKWRLLDAQDNRLKMVELWELAKNKNNNQTEK